MSLEQAIHQQWASHAPLTALLPADRLFTGAAAPAAPGTAIALPYATLARRATRRVERTSDGRELMALVVQLSIRAASLDQGKSIAAAAHTAFAGQSFSASGVTVQDMKRIAQREASRDVDRWHIDLDYLTRVESSGP